MKNKILLIFMCSIYVHVNGQNLQFPIIVDTLPKTNVNYYETTVKRSFQRIPFYIGNYKDTIIAGRYHSDVRIPIREHFIIANKETETRYPWAPDSSIVFSLNEKSNTTLELYDYKKESYVKYYGRTLIIQNVIDSSIRIGYGYDIPVLIEAQTKDGLWQAIESRHFYDCGVGLHYILLRPKEIACMIIPEYKGGFKTLLRLKLGNNYSKPFKGRINIKQFENVRHQD